MGEYVSPYTLACTPLELFHILSHFNHQCKSILLVFYVIDQHKVVHNGSGRKMIHGL